MAGHIVVPLRQPGDSNWNPDPEEQGQHKIPLQRNYHQITPEQSQKVRKQFGDDDRGAGALVTGDLFAVDADVLTPDAAEIVRVTFEEGSEFSPHVLAQNPNGFG